MSTLLEISGLRVRYRSGRSEAEALRGIDLSLSASERVAVIGESGSGKSTLALAIAGLLPRDTLLEGDIRWPGLAHAPRNGKDIGFVFQDPGGTLDPVISVGRQVAEVAEVNLGFSRRRAMDLAAELFERVRLQGTLLHAYPHQLSGGQRQRVGIAAAIAAGPAVLVADEPTSALDTIVQAEIVSLIGRLVRESGMALLIVSHDIALAVAIADRIVVLKDGAVVEAGESAEIVARPRAAYTQKLLAACLTLDETADEGAL
ncbi:ABC transporter ATP-binding protein [Mesorhizobium sp. LHD-90]|uniref:ABC transporter ATP-binding protein n=1 Tax=Mesorhizobium sp. LHD-90 TaxID=3071414 RepID=UPI0027DF26F8|nr:ABC transporter ATP-binding protein [Mesorhizobium sp. LHD-90]MDQ6434153.1 ABC transporter ATP-binding protein [Mesorhizobium sp. LHD-90]